MCLRRIWSTPLWNDNVWIEVLPSLTKMASATSQHAAMIVENCLTAVLISWIEQLFIETWWNSQGLQVSMKILLLTKDFNDNGKTHYEHKFRRRKLILIDLLTICIHGQAVSYEAPSGSSLKPMQEFSENTKCVHKAIERHEKRRIKENSSQFVSFNTHYKRSSLAS